MTVDNNNEIANDKLPTTGQKSSQSMNKDSDKQNDKDLNKKKTARYSKKQRWDDRLTPADYARYIERTERLARGSNQTVDTGHLETYIRFRLGVSEKYGIEFNTVDEILYATGIACVPSTPDFIAGVINHSGDMLTIIDLRSFFRAEKRDYGVDARVIIVEGGGLRVGLLVDEVDGNDYYDLAKLAPPLPSAGVSDLRYVKGIHQGSITIIDIEALLSDQAIRVG